MHGAAGWTLPSWAGRRAARLRAAGLAVHEHARLDRQASRRQLVDGHVAEVAVRQQRERARDGRGGHHEHVRRRPRLGRQPRALLHAKAARRASLSSASVKTFIDGIHILA